MAGMVKPLLRSFSSGEVTPELFGRIDLDKMQSGLALASNMRTLPTGPAQNRAGFAYVLQARNSSLLCRMIPFVFSADQSMALEFTEQKVRFHTAGQTLLEAVQALTAPFMSLANPGVWTLAGHGFTNGQWVYCTSISTTFFAHGRFFIVANATANTFTLTDLRGTAVNTLAETVPAFLVNFARVYEVATPYVSTDLMSLHYTQSADVLTITHPTYPVYELRRLGATNWTMTAQVFTPPLAPPAITTAAGGPGGGTPINHTYKITSIRIETLEESLPSASGTLSRDLTVAGNYIDVSPTALDSGAVRYSVYKLGNGGLYGYVGQTDGTTPFRDTNVTPDLTLSPPEAATPFAATGDYPSTCTYMEQRKCFAATNNNPQKVWMTRSATEGNLSQSIPVRDSDAIIFKIAAVQQNRIRHLVPLVDLIALTTGGEFRIYAGSGDALTPANVTPKPQSYVGANNVQPCVAEASVLYAQNQGGHVREFAYAGTGINGATYSSNDVSILAPHLFDGFSVVDMAYSRTAACPTLWCVRSDGVLLGMTYVPGQGVRAWHQNSTTGGLFESVCCVPESGEDALYAVVKRTIAGADWRYVERLHTRTFTDPEAAFFVDSGLTYSGTAATTIRGLWHLEGQTLKALADGAVVRNLLVTNGTITLPAAASTVHVGLPITSGMKTLPLSWQADGFGQGVIKNVGKVHLRLAKSSGVHIGPADGDLIEVKQRQSEVFGAPPDLIDGWKHVNIAPQWQDDGGVEIEQTDPLPITVLCMVLDTISGG